MTKQEFISQYMKRSQIAPEFRTDEGFTVGSVVRVAIPCDCDDPSCRGWQMSYQIDYEATA